MHYRALSCIIVHNREIVEFFLVILHRLFEVIERTRYRQEPSSAKGENSSLRSLTELLFWYKLNYDYPHIGDCLKKLPDGKK